MNDGLDALRRSDPVRGVSPAVAVDEETLGEAFAAADPRRRATRRPGRIGYAAAAAIVAGVFVPVALMSARETTSPAFDRPADPIAPPPSIDPESVQIGDDRRNGVATTATSEAPPEVHDRPPTATVPDSSVATAAPIEVVPPSAVSVTIDGTEQPTTVPVVAPPPPTTPAPTAVPSTAPEPTTPPPTTSVPTSAPPSTAPRATSISGPFDPSDDLLVVTFDFAHRDDAHAGAATRELATWFELTPIVVAGTPAGGETTHDGGAVMAAIWGDGWFDAGQDRAGVVDRVATRWLETLDRGGDVWVAEGGVSDFTAEVLEQVRSARPALSTVSRVHVVHHAGRNLDETVPAAAELVGAHTDLLRIGDGNHSNDTADLAASSATFEDLARSGRHGSAWDAAFAMHPPSSLDFSDTVTVLHALGVGVERVAGVDDFADAFMR